MANFASAEPSTFLVETKSGVSADEYAQEVAAVVQPLGGGDATTGSESGKDGIILIMAAMAVLLTSC